jgi:hypothetical protein
MNTNLAGQDILLTCDVVCGPSGVKTKTTGDAEGVWAIKGFGPVLLQVIAMAAGLGEARVEAVRFRGELMISVLTSPRNITRLSKSNDVDFSNLCVCVSRVAKIPIYFWAGAGWSACARDGELHVEIGTTPPPWVCATDLVEN